MLRDLEQRQQQLPLSSESHSIVKPTFHHQVKNTQWIWLCVCMSLVFGLLAYENQANKTPAVKTNLDIQPLLIPNFAYSGDHPESTDNMDVQTVISQPLPSDAVNVNKPQPRSKISKSSTHGHKHKKIRHKNLHRHRGSNKHTIKSELNNNETHSTINTENNAQKSEHEQAIKLFQQAQSAGISVTSRTQLEAALNLEPNYLPARSMLLQVLLKDNISTPELSAFLDNSVKLFPEEMTFIKPRAHLYIQNKEFGAALALLERVNSNTTDDQTYLALLAVSYQQTQQFKAASDIYLRLCTMQAEKAENWLGLAISYDNLNEKNRAISAYQQAFTKNTLDSQIMDYIKQRLRVLNQ